MAINNLEEFKVYQNSIEVSENIWKVVNEWNYFQKDTIGKQLVRSADSISANLSEGLGRYFYKETRQFSYYARGSLFETKTWLLKAYRRKLINEEFYQSISGEIDKMGRMLNSYIRSLNSL